MKLSQVKKNLEGLEGIQFSLENGETVPDHFHVTEVGKVSKHYIDCGGTIRMENVVSFQLWTDQDTEHRLKASKLLNIIAMAEKLIGIEDLEVEVEYQAKTIGKFGIDFDGEKFILTSKQTDCLAKENCGIPAQKPKVKLADLQNKNSCSPGGGCC